MFSKLKNLFKESDDKKAKRLASQKKPLNAEETKFLQDYMEKGKKKEEWVHLGDENHSESKRRRAPPMRAPTTGWPLQPIREVSVESDVGSLRSSLRSSSIDSNSSIGSENWEDAQSKGGRKKRTRRRKSKRKRKTKKKKRKRRRKTKKRRKKRTRKR